MCPFDMGTFDQVIKLRALQCPEVFGYYSLVY